MTKETLTEEEMKKRLFSSGVKVGGQFIQPEGYTTSINGKTFKKVGKLYMEV